MRACTSATREAASKQLLKEIRLGTLRSIKERIESSPESSEATSEGALAKCIGIKPRLLGCRSILVVSGALLVILEDLSLRVRAIQPGQANIGNRPLYVLRTLLVSPEIFPLRSCQDLYLGEIYEQAVWHVRRFRR